jgi:stage II sporulation protein D
VLLALSGGSVKVAGTTVRAAGKGLRVGNRSVGAVWRVEAGTGWLSAAGLRVPGAVEVRRVPEGVRVVGEIPLESYVAGTVGKEVYADWELETLKAQAVVARTYALYRAQRRAEQGFDLEGGTHGQVYGGLDAAHPAALKAARATRGQRLTWRDEPILAVYHSASGGRTASAEEVWGEAVAYLVSHPVENEEDSPDTYWRARVSGPTLSRALEPLGIRVGPVRALRVLERSRSGRVLRLSVRGARGTGELNARALRSALGETVIRSTMFQIRADGKDFVLVGSGYGHGVGMSQWGAEAMAERGARYPEILAAFYPGTQLTGPQRAGPQLTGPRLGGPRLSATRPIEATGGSAR